MPFLSSKDFVIVSIMDLQSGGKCIYKSKPISPGDLYKVLEDRCDSRLTTNNDTNKRKTSLDIKENNIGYFFLSKAAGPMESLFQVALILAEAGIDITLVADPPSRHHSKRATLRGLVWNVSIFRLSWRHFFKERFLLQLKASVNLREKFSLSGMKV